MTASTLPLRAALLALAAIALACTPPTRHDDDEDPKTGCVPGQSSACVCTDGRSGAQVCGDDGRFGACECAGGTDGGEAGDGGTDGGEVTDGGSDGGTPTTPCEKMCSRVYDVCELAFQDTAGNPVDEARCISICDGGGVTTAQRDCFTTTGCAKADMDACFAAGQKQCPRDADCSRQECGPDPVCGVSCGGCADTQVCNAHGACVAMHGWVRDVANKGHPEQIGFAIDSAGIAHSALLESTGNLYYGLRGAGVWPLQLVQVIGVDRYSIAQRVRLLTGANGAPHLVYWHKGTTAELRYARREGSVWAFETIDPTDPGSGKYPSAVLDSQGRLHVAYMSSPATGEKLKYARRDANGAWTVMAVDADVNSGYFTSIAVDAQDRPHIAYDVGYLKVRHARWNDGAWVKTELSSGDRPAFVSVAVDRGGVPHVVWHSKANFAIRYARGGETGFTVETVAGAGDANGHNEVAVDASGNVHVAYMETGSNVLGYAMKPAAGGAWQVETVDPRPNAGMYIDLALTPAGLPWVLYRTNRLDEGTMLARFLP